MSRSTRVLLSVAVGFSAAGGQAAAAASRLAPAAAVTTATTAAAPQNLAGNNAAQNRNSITGLVFSEARRPMPDVFIELLDEYGGTINRARTTASGRFSFGGLAQGRYKIKVLPYGTDYQEQLKEIELVTVSAIPGSGVDHQQVDFYLRLRPGANAGPLAAPGAVFAQEVPEAAAKLYERAVVELREKRDKEGYESLKRALEIFPEYYLALDRLGTEYVVRGHYAPAFILLTKAIEINPRSFSSLFGLGMAQYYLKQNDQAVENLQRASTLYNKSPNVYLWLGLALRRAGKLPDAEAAFKRAAELSQGKHPDAHWQLALLLSDQKRYKEAADELELFLKSRPDARDAEKIRQLIAQLREKEKASR
jgi:Flp pilus assembly protein TadD